MIVHLIKRLTVKNTIHVLRNWIGEPTTTYALAVDKILLVNIVLDANRVKHQLQIIKIILVLKRNEINYFFYFLSLLRKFVFIYYLSEHNWIDDHCWIDDRDDTKKCIRCGIVLLSEEDNMCILPFGPVEICGSERYGAPDKVNNSAKNSLT